MNEHEVFPHAPITEAVLDIRVDPDPGLELSALQRMHDRISDRFPDVERLAGIESEVQVSRAGARTQTSVRPTGFLFRSPDQDRIVQAAQGGFTFNRLPPYESWEPLRDEAKPLWQEYCEHAHPQGVTRLALRYINRIELPLPLDDFKQYLLTVPEVAPGIRQGLKHFFMRLEIPYPDLPAVAVVITAVDQSGVTPSMVPIIFDIDVIHEAHYEPNSSDIWHRFKELRDVKNLVFFSSITDAAKELFR